MAEHDNLDPAMAAAFGASAPRITRRVFARRTSIWLLAGGAMAVRTACGTGSAASKEDVAALREEIAAIKRGATDAHADPKAAGAHDTKHWAYEGEGGPEKWADLAPENAVCRTGGTQSPIDIVKSQSGVGGRTNI